MAQGTHKYWIWQRLVGRGEREDAYRNEVQMVADEPPAFRDRIGYVLHEGRESCGQRYTLGVCFFVRDMMALFSRLCADRKIDWLHQLGPWR